MTTFHPELGQYGLSNTPWQDVESPAWINPGLEEIATAISTLRGDDAATGYLLTSNCGADPYETDIFAMRSYCWCDGEEPGHENGCPTNFEYHPTGLTIGWYKHSRRSRSQNQVLPRLEWEVIVVACLDDVAAQYHA